MSKRVAIVTGVSRLKGIGRAICIALARQGHDVCFTYYQAYDAQMEWGIDTEAIATIQKELTALGVKSFALEMDLTDKSAADTIMQSVESELGPVSILINNATYSTQSDIQHIEADILDQHYAVNVKANVLLTKAFINRFKIKQHGRIINISSGQSLGPMDQEIAYAVTKSAIDNLTFTLASSIASKGISINAVNPGPTDTGWMTEAQQQKLLAASPMKRVGTPEDVAKLVAFLVSEEAEWITGQLIHSEGGFDRYRKWA